MTEEDLIALWRGEQPIYEAWGKYVVSTIIALVKEHVGEAAAPLFFKMEPKYRLKEEKSFVTKALHRKVYADPYNEVEDKVGARFIVLLSSEIDLVSRLVEEHDAWDYSKDRDYDAEQAERPIQFEYAAVHYILKCRRAIEIEGQMVPLGTPCEIQIKTILQHAYSELTHDTIYKPSVKSTPKMVRAAAKSMALLEATGDYFEQVIRLVEEAVETAKGTSVDLETIYRTEVGLAPVVTALEGMILEAYEGMAGGDVPARVRSVLASKTFIGAKVRARSASSLVYRQPSILLTYLMVVESPTMAKANWPLTADQLRPIYTDLGLSFDDY